MSHAPEKIAEENHMQPALPAVLQRLDALINWERRDRDASMRRGLAPLEALLLVLGKPQEGLRAVHITGTKGKGTTAALVAAGAAAAGLKTGLYTSPHLESIHERIRVDGRSIDDAALSRLLSRVLDARDACVERGDAGSESTWFDCLTAAALLHFIEQRVDLAVIEVGLGGRLDSTNVVFGEVCVLTNVELEHTNVLGPTRRHIATEKVGIVKKGSVLVTGVEPSGERGDDDAGAVVDAQCVALGVPVLRPVPGGSSIRATNLALARAALDQLGARGWAVSAATLDSKLADRAWLPGRLERRKVGRTPVLLDAAHVAESVERVLGELRGQPELSSRPTVLLALGRDKDATAILKVLAKHADRLICTTVASGPLVDAGTLAHKAQELGITVETAAEPAAGLARALQTTQADGWVLAIGSFYLVGAVRPLTQTSHEPSDRCSRSSPTSS